jgi:cell fate regulator YaaT (PSP1 superfamily)
MDGKVTVVFAGEVAVRKGERIVVETEEGPEFAEVTTLTPVLAKACAQKKARRLLRLASDSESADFAERQELQEEAARFASKRIEEMRLPVSLVKCVVPFDRRRITVLYSSDERANLRELCHEMSEAFRLRVDARMVGVRDETKIIGGIGPCGLTLCCSTWLRGFHPVTIRMAKLQGITPNPSKLTGMCGRLKCCLAYELEGGIEAARKMSSKGHERKDGERKGPPPPPP